MTQHPTHPSKNHRQAVEPRHTQDQPSGKAPHKGAAEEVPEDVDEQAEEVVAEEAATEAAEAPDTSTPPTGQPGS